MNPIIFCSSRFLRKNREFILSMALSMKLLLTVSIINHVCVSSVTMNFYWGVWCILLDRYAMLYLIP